MNCMLPRLVVKWPAQLSTRPEKIASEDYSFFCRRFHAHMHTAGSQNGSRVGERRRLYSLEPQLIQFGSQLLAFPLHRRVHTHTLPFRALCDGSQRLRMCIGSCGVKGCRLSATRVEAEMLLVEGNFYDKFLKKFFYSILNREDKFFK